MSSVRNEEGRKVTRAILADGELVGSIGLGPRQLGEDELGYWIGKAYWGRGIASEAVRQFIALLDELGIDGPIDAQTMAANAASQRVLEKNGFRYIGSGECVTPARETESKPSKRYVLERPRRSGNAA